MNKSGMISIACASAFWGDTAFATAQVLRAPQLDFIAYDYLSEVTMALLARAQKKDPQAGYAADFLTDVIEPHLKEILQRKIRLVSNAGGLNSPALMRKIEECAERLGVAAKVICVEGDDIRALPEAQGFTSANAYLGAPAVVQALNDGADIVLCGRTADTSLIVGPIFHHFKASFENYDLLAQASLAGHILECGTQCTGGNFTDWSRVPGRDDVGFPIAVVEASGRFSITKPPGTGGLLETAAVAEQILYEIGNPRAYILPDVVCDFSQVTLTQKSAAVEVEGARGLPPTPTYKVSATKQMGWRVSTTAYIGGGEARPKAKAVGEAILARCARLLKERGLPAFSETRLEVLGGGEEVLLRLSAAHERPEPLDVLAKEIAPAGTSLAPGVANLLGGRAHAVPRMAFSSFLIHKSKVPVQLVHGTQKDPVEIPRGQEFREPPAQIQATASKGPSVEVPLVRLAFARSGDKGNHINIGVIARRPEYYSVLQTAVSREKVAQFFAADFDGREHRVDVWDLPGLHALNFLIYDCLGGGGSFSLRVDPQGKAFAQRLLQMPITVPQDWEKL